jgi:hypothetical protein
MRTSKRLAAAGILSLTLLTGTALTGAAYADTHSTSKAATPVQSRTDKGKNTDRHDRSEVGGKGQDKHRRTSASISATVTREKVQPGDSYSVAITTTGVGNGTRATIKGIDGNTYTATVHNGKANKTLKVSGGTKPGSYTATVSVGSLHDSADLTVVRGKH